MLSWTQIVKAALALAVIVAFFWLVWMIKHILVPFAFAGLLAYLLNPMVRSLQNRGVNRSVGGTLAVLTIVTVLVFMIFIPWPIVSSQMSILQERLPTMLSHTQSILTQSTFLQEFLPQGAGGESWFEQLRILIAENVNLSNLSQKAWSYFRQGGSAILNVLSWLVLMPILTFFLLANWPSTVKMLRRLIPLSWRADVFKVTKDMDLMLAQFVRGQLLVMLILAIYYAVGLKLTGLDVAVSVGVLTGLFVMIPFLGFGLGLILGCLSALLQFGLTPPFFAVLAVYALGQVIESYVLTPRLVGERIGLSPVAVIFSLMVFGALFGLFGVLFALPAAAVVAVLVRYGRDKYFSSSFYNRSSSARS